MKAVRGFRKTNCSVDCLHRWMKRWLSCIRGRQQQGTGCFIFGRTKICSSSSCQWPVARGHNGGEEEGEQEADWVQWQERQVGGEQHEEVVENERWRCSSFVE